MKFLPLVNVFLLFVGEKKKTSLLIPVLLSDFFIHSMLQSFLCNISLAWCVYRPSWVGWRKKILCSVTVRI